MIPSAWSAIFPSVLLRPIPSISKSNPSSLYSACSVWINSRGSPGPRRTLASPDHFPTRKLSFRIAERCDSRFGVRGGWAIGGSNADDHDFGGFDKRGCFVADFEAQLAHGIRRDNRSDALAANREGDLRHEAIDLDFSDAADELVA